MLRRPPRSTRTDTLFPYTTLFRSQIRKLVSVSKDAIAKVRDTVGDMATRDSSVSSGAQEEVNRLLGQVAAINDGLTQGLRTVAEARPPISEAVGRAVRCLHDRKRVWEGKSVSVRVALGGRGILK